MHTWLNNQPLWAIGLLLTVLMAVSLRLGRFLAIVHARHQGELPDNSKSLISYLMALTAFLLGFAFSMSNSRYEERRQAIVHEANAIGTAILRADLYPDTVRARLVPEFKQYLTNRIAFFKAGASLDSATRYEALSNIAAARLWAIATAYSRESKDMVTTTQMIPALNDMFDSATTRHYALVSKVPEPVLYLLFLLASISAFFAGYSGPKERINRFVSATFCILTVLVVALIMDLDRPRRGLIRFNDTHEAIESLMQLFEL